MDMLAVEGGSYSQVEWEGRLGYPLQEYRVSCVLFIHFLNCAIVPSTIGIWALRKRATWPRGRGSHSIEILLVHDTLGDYP